MSGIEGRYETIVSPEVLRNHLEDARWLVLDCRHNLQDFTAGRKAYDTGHIPGAFFADVEHDLAGEKTGKNGRHPMPDPERFAAFLRNLGAADDTQIVAYDEGADMYAARAWFLCKWIGHDAVAVLDGGMSAWRALGYPLTTASPPFDSAQGDNPFDSAQDDNPFDEPALSARAARSRRARRGGGDGLAVRLRPELTVSAGEVLANIGSDTMTVLDARAPERFRGDTEPVDPVAGHIPGARNRSFRENFDARGRLKAPQELRDAYARYGDPARVAHQCGSGVSAAVNALAMEHAELRGWRLYPGSWSEWVSDPSRPVETGPEKR